MCSHLEESHFVVEVSCLDSVERYKGGHEYKYIVLECEEDSPHRTVPAHANILFHYCVSVLNCVALNCVMYYGITHTRACSSC